MGPLLIRCRVIVFSFWQYLGHKGGVLLEIVRYINHVPVEGALTPVKISNPGLVKLLRDVQLKLLSKETSDSGKGTSPM